MAIDFTAVTVASVIGGAIVSVVSNTFGAKVKPECKERLDKYAECIHDIELKLERSDEYKIALERRMSSMDGKLDTILNRLTK